MIRKPRGFAALSAEDRRAISSKGGQAGGHRWTPAEARKQSKRGGRASAAKRKESA